VTLENNGLHRREDRGEPAGLAHVAAPAARRRPDKKRSRSFGLRQGTSPGITKGVMARSRATIARASSNRPTGASANRIVGRAGVVSTITQ
jgi:hypothetical protein